MNVVLSDAARQILIQEIPSRISERRRESDRLRSEARTYLCETEDYFTGTLPTYIKAVEQLQKARMHLNNINEWLRWSLPGDPINIHQIGAIEILEILTLDDLRCRKPTKFGMTLEGNYPNLHKEVQKKAPDFKSDRDQLRAAIREEIEDVSA